MDYRIPIELTDIKWFIIFGYEGTDWLDCGPFDNYYKSNQYLV